MDEIRDHTNKTLTASADRVYYVIDSCTDLFVHIHPLLVYQEALIS
jgi:hypothetical protein